MHIIGQDILNIEGRPAIIVHQVNCQGKMGAGLAKQIADRYPHAKEVYELECSGVRTPDNLLGDIASAKIYDDLWIVGLFAQLNYGREPGKCYTNYFSLVQSIGRLQGMRGDPRCAFYNFPVYVPYGMGAGLAGGDWSKIIKILDVFLDDATICKLPGIVRPGRG